VAAEDSDSALGPGGRRMLEAIGGLSEGKREVFHLMRIRGMMEAQVARSLGGSAVTVKRRLNRGLRLLSEQRTDLRPGAKPPG
jgi:DNA-directed RNA polymerase specialized sigma24 family protein